MQIRAHAIRHRRKGRALSYERAVGSHDVLVRITHCSLARATAAWPTISSSTAGSPSDFRRNSIQPDQPRCSRPVLPYTIAEPTGSALPGGVAFEAVVAERRTVEQLSAIHLWELHRKSCGHHAYARVFSEAWHRGHCRSHAVRFDSPGTAGQIGLVPATHRLSLHQPTCSRSVAVPLRLLRPGSSRAGRSLPSAAPSDRHRTDRPAIPTRAAASRNRMRDVMPQARYQHPRERSERCAGAGAVSQWPFCWYWPAEVGAGPRHKVTRATRAPCSRETRWPPYRQTNRTSRVPGRTNIRTEGWSA
jgi:hypothetical protein